MSEESFQVFVRRAALGLAQSRLQARGGAPLSADDLALCVLEAALLFKHSEAVEIYSPLDDVTDRHAALRERCLAAWKADCLDGLWPAAPTPEGHPRL